MAYTCLVCGGKMKKTGTGYEPWECVDCYVRHPKAVMVDLLLMRNILMTTVRRLMLDVLLVAIQRIPIVSQVVQCSMIKEVYL